MCVSIERLTALSARRVAGRTDAVCGIADSLELGRNGVVSSARCSCNVGMKIRRVVLQPQPVTDAWHRRSPTGTAVSSQLATSLLRRPSLLVVLIVVILPLTGDRTTAQRKCEKWHKPVLLTLSDPPRCADAGPNSVRRNQTVHRKNLQWRRLRKFFTVYTVWQKKIAPFYFSNRRRSVLLQLSTVEKSNNLVRW